MNIETLTSDAMGEENENIAFINSTTSKKTNIGETRISGASIFCSGTDRKVCTLLLRRLAENQNQNQKEKENIMLLRILCAFAACLVIGNSSVVHAERYTVSLRWGWQNPFHGRDMVTDDAFDYLSDDYETNWGIQHVGVDIMADLGEFVYPIADGRIIHFKRYDDVTKNISVVRIQHQTWDGQVFTAIYGHCKALDGLAVGDLVHTWTPICQITRYGSPDHLHLGVNTEDSYTDKWGTLPLGEDPDDHNWVSPIDFLNNNPRGAYP